MKRITKILSVILALSMVLSLTPIVSNAAATKQAVPYKNEFLTNGYVPTELTGFTMSGGSMKVVDGVLRTSSVDNKEMFTTLEFQPVSSGTLVVELDWYSSAATGAESGFIFMYDSAGKEVVKLLRTSNGANAMYANAYKAANKGVDNLNSIRVGNNGKTHFKFEIDLSAKKWKIFQSNTFKNNEWVYTQLQRESLADSTVIETEFPFTDSAAAGNVTSLKFRFATKEVHSSSNSGGGIDNLKIYKKVTATQTASSYTLLDGETAQAGITFTPAADKPTDLVWESSDTSVATVDNTGLITAVSEGNATINVKSIFYEEINFNYAVTVSTGATGISIDKAESTVCEGDTLELKASAVPQNTVLRNIVWSSSDTSVATVTPDGGDSKKCTVTATGKGTATITVTGEGAGGSTVSATATVNVLRPLTGLSISAPQTSFVVGESAAFSAVLAPAGASEVPKQWRTGNHYIATVDQNGVVRAVGEGSTEIYLSASTFTASQTITVASNTTQANRKPGFISFYTPSGYSFYDIADMEWAQSAVYSAVNMGVINPDGETTFGAKRNIKRDEFVSVVVKTLGLMNKQGDSEAVKGFTDVAEDNPYYAEVMKALELGIIQGVSDTEFAPNADITRQDMSVVVTNAFKVASVKTEEGRLDFADKEQIAEYAQTAVRILSKMGIIVGKGNNIFDPLANTTRAEVCVIVDRINAVR